jgi:hypothetical protein
LSKDNSSARSKEDDDRGRPAMDSSGLPEGFDSFVSGKALQADQIDEDKHVILKWLNSLPKEVIDVSN